MYHSAPRRKRPREGFTLVEMLVVIVIIGLLASMITGAAIMARSSARQSVDKTDVTQLAMAVEKYRTEYGEYPPDFAFINNNMSDPADPVRRQARDELFRHIRKRWPRYTGTLTVFINSLADFGLAERPSNLTDDHMIYRIFLDPASALPFWLGGLPESATNLTPSGFHEDPSNPFKMTGPRTQPLFDFVAERFVWKESDPFTAGAIRGMRYYPASATMPQGNPATVNEYAPYVYFKARRLAACENRYEYGYVDNPAAPTALVPAFYHHGPADSSGAELLNVAVPYLDVYPGPAPYWDATVDDPTDATIVPPPAVNDLNPSSGVPSLDYVRRRRNLESYQILCPGLDGQYGDVTVAAPTQRFRFSRSGENFSQEDMDNTANFITKGTLEDEMQ